MVGGCDLVGVVGGGSGLGKKGTWGKCGMWCGTIATSASFLDHWEVVWCDALGLGVVGGGRVVGGASVV